MVQDDSVTNNTIGIALSSLAGVIWVVYALTGPTGWLLVVAIVVSMVAGWWWAFGRRLVSGNGFATGGRQPNRQRRR